MPERAKSRKSTRHGPWTAEKAMHSLTEVLEVVQYRDRLKPDQKNRVQDAMSLAEETTLADTTSVHGATFVRRLNYWEFLRSIRSCGKDVISLCAIGLGQSVIGRMSKTARLDLAKKIREQMSTLKCPSLENIFESLVSVPVQDDQSFETLNNHTIIPTTQQTSLLGDFYELTLQDARSIVMSDQIRGQIWLTDSYDPNTLSFISIPISDELKTQYIIQRQLGML